MHASAQSNRVSEQRSVFHAVRFAKQDAVLKIIGMRLKSIIAFIEGLPEQQRTGGRRPWGNHRGKEGFLLWSLVICLVLPLSGCHEKEPSAREVLEQVCANMEGMSEWVFTARVEMVMSVYEETMQLEARSRVQASFLAGCASESVELYRDQKQAEAFTYSGRTRRCLRPSGTRRTSGGF